MTQLKNSVRLIGNLGMNPDVKKLSSGKKLARLSLATTESYKDENGQRISDTQWHNLVAWGKQAEVAEKYLQKGSEVAVEGKLVHRQYTDKTGAIRYSTEVVINELLMLGAKK